MKKILLFFSLTIFMSGCMVSQKIEKQRYDCKISLDETSINKKDSLTYEDETIKIEFLNDRKSLCFKLQNKTSIPIYIDWDACSLVQKGQSQRVIHGGINLAHRNEPQAKTVVSPGTTVEDGAVPSDNIYYSEGLITGYYNVLPEWKHKDLFIVTNKKGLSKSDILNQKGEKFSFLLSYEFDSKRYSKVFNFIISDVTERHKVYTYYE